MSDDERIRIFDTTLRDGEQSPGCSMNLAEKLALARQLERLGVDVIEAGFPIASEGDFEAVQGRRRANSAASVTVCGLARTGDRGHRARGAARSRGAAAPAHPHLHRDQRHPPPAQAAMSRERGARRGRPRGAPGARSTCDDVEFSAEDATRSDWDYLVQVFERRARGGRAHAERAGHRRLHDAGRVRRADPLPARARPGSDRVGVLAALPQRPRPRRREHPGGGPGRRAPGRVHGQRHRRARRQHRDGRGGDGDQDAPRRLRRPRHAHPHRRRSTRRAACSRRSSASPVQPNKAIVGDNAFAHEAGIHQDGVLKAAITYEIMTPQSIGRPSNELVLGKHSGRHALPRAPARSSASSSRARSSSAPSSASRTSPTRRRRSTTRTSRRSSRTRWLRTEERFVLGDLTVLSGHVRDADGDGRARGRRRRAQGDRARATARWTRLQGDRRAHGDEERAAPLPGERDHGRDGRAGRGAVTLSEGGRRVIGHGAHYRHHRGERARPTCTRSTSSSGTSARARARRASRKGI